MVMSRLVLEYSTQFAKTSAFMELNSFSGISRSLVPQSKTRVNSASELKSVAEA